MSIEFILTSELSTKDLHLKIIDAATEKALFDTNADNFEEKKREFVEKYRSAWKSSLADLSRYMVEAGRELLARDPNSKTVLQRTTSYLFNALEFT